MEFLIENLKAFNRKERFYLLAQALQWEEQEPPRFSLHERFREALGNRIGLDIPADAFAAMDYHLEWLYASLCLACFDAESLPYADPAKLIVGNQEDVDLLIAFRQGAVTHLVLTEAKADTSWSNTQMASKVPRLRAIFEAGPKDEWPGVRPHLVLMSPNESKGLKTDSWPEWMKNGGKPAWLPLRMPAPLWKVSRCDKDGWVGVPAVGSCGEDARWWGPVRGHRKRVEPFPRQAR